MTATTILTKKMQAFAAAHTLPNHDGGCYNLHGHNYDCDISVIGELIPGAADRPDASMIIDFSHLKNIYKTRVHDRLDHALILGQKLPKWYQTMLEGIKIGSRDAHISPKVHADLLLGKVAHLPIDDTTAECLSSWIYEQMASGLVDSYKASEVTRPEIYSVSVYETTTSIATYFNPRYRPMSTDEIYYAIEKRFQKDRA